MNNESVRVYDFETEETTQIPARELADTMAAATVEGVEGRVYVDARQAAAHDEKTRRELGIAPGIAPFDEDARDFLREIKSSVDEFYCQTLEEWENGFRKDENPEMEIALWLHLARKYRGFTTSRNLTKDQRFDYYKLFLTCLNNPREHVLSIYSPEVITPKQVNEGIAYFYEPSKD